MEAAIISADYVGCEGLFVPFQQIGAAREAGGAHRSKPDSDGPLQSARHGHCPVLIIEDDADLREMMAQLLSLEGYQAHVVSNGREALDYLHNGAERPELILLDLMMPVMDGWEFRRVQRSDPDLADVPVIVLSALDPARGTDVGAIEFLKKPLDFDRLLELVRQYCS
jgi:CheY-like chemotaxis protein